MPTLALVRARRGKPYHFLVNGDLASLAVLDWQIFLKQALLSSSFTDIGPGEFFHLQFPGPSEQGFHCLSLLQQDLVVALVALLLLRFTSEYNRAFSAVYLSSA